MRLLSACQSPHQSSRSDPFLVSIAVSALVASVAMFAAAPAQAVTTLSVDTTDGTTSVLPGNFDPNVDGLPFPMVVGDPITVFDTADPTGGLEVTPSQNVTLRFTFVGKEAGNTNTAASSFVWNGSDVLFDTLAAVGTSVTVTFSDLGIAPALVPFLFETNGACCGNPGAYAANGGPISSGLAIAFSNVFSTDMYGNAFSTVYAFFGDGLGDKDFDDMVVEISAVPVPPALLLFGSGLTELGLLARRRRKKSALAAISA